MHFSSAGRGKTVTKRSRRSGWEDTSKVSGFAYPEGDSSDSDRDNEDPDDPGTRDDKPDPKELQQLKPNDYIMYRYGVRFLYYYSYMNTRYLFLLNLKFVYDKNV